MDWKERPWLESGHLIWVAELDGRWLASLAALPRSGGLATAGPGAEVIPGDFETEEAAENAAKRFIIQKNTPQSKTE